MINEEIFKDDLTSINFIKGSYKIGFVENKIFYNKKEILFSTWYPSDEDEEDIFYMKYLPGKSKQNAKYITQNSPLIVVSHGSRGNRYNHYFLCEHLASQGYIVASIEHPSSKENSNDGLGQLYNRPKDISAVLDYILNNELFSNSIDPDKIAIIGFSAGGFSAVSLIGANPNFSIDKSFIPYIKLNNLEDKCNFYDKRIKAAVLMAPALSHIFENSQLNKLNIPVYLFTSSKDEIIENSTDKYLKEIKCIKKHTKYIDAGHYVYNMLYPKIMQKIYKEECHDIFFKREIIHPHLSNNITNFFNEYLKG